MKLSALSPVLLLSLLLVVFPAVPGLAQTAPAAPKSPRIYIFDCGTIQGMDVTLYGFKDGEVQIHDFVVPCYLIVHPKGTLIWDVGTMPDSALSGGGPVTQGVMTIRRTLRSQLAEIGYQPEQINYLAFSHYHTDHTANANDFAKSTWLVRQAELDLMFGPPPAPGAARRIIQTQSFSALKDSKRKVLTENEYDVFGDKTVLIKSAPGHTPGHQVLFVKTRNDGPVLIAGDLYHYPEEGPLNRFPTFEFDKAQSAISRREIAEFVKKHKAQMWIEHDPATYQKQKKSPAFYQ
jgi:N-acyl homoserine lactone hydrolase